MKAKNDMTLTKSKLKFQNGNIEFKNVLFSYENRNNFALDGISFTIEKGKTTAIVGESGSGKSTIINLLMRFIESKSGEIFIGGNNLENILENKWHEKVGWVSQTPHIFHKSIFENIAIAKKNATESEIIDAAKKAFIHDSIIKLKDGYNAIVEENGATLSGGEIQRIALARIFLKNAPILLMDEPTSSIDSIYEASIFSSIKSFVQGKTVVIVAHRLNTILNSDKIIVMEHGKIIAEGMHQNLLVENKIYQNLYNTFKREM